AVEASDDVAQARVHRPVRHDDRRDPSVEREVHRRQGGEAAEPLGDAERLEAGWHQTCFASSRARRRTGKIPCGRKIIMRMRMTPKIIRSYFAGSSCVGRSAR